MKQRKIHFILRECGRHFSSVRKDGARTEPYANSLSAVRRRTADPTPRVRYQSFRSLKIRYRWSVAVPRERRAEEVSVNCRGTGEEPERSG